MNILVLHNVEDLGRARRSTLDYIFAFERYQPHHTYHYQKISDPPSAEVIAAPWDAVILESTSLGIVTIRPRDLYFRLRDRWAFLKDEQIVKVAFPQDDANCGGLMDDWFADWGFQFVFSVRAPEHWPVLYPRSVQSARFLSCLSGYIDDNSLDLLQTHAKPWKARQRLIGQRVTMYPYRGGRQGRMKGLIAEAVKAAAISRGLKQDISTDPADTFFGDGWYDFLGDCKFVLGTEGGLSLHDPYGEIADRIEAFLSAHPSASFEETEAACFPGLDGVHVFSGFTPRVLEAAVCEASQVLVEGHYLGAIEPETHYISLKSDLSNLDAVLDSLADEKAARRRIKACQEALVQNPDFRFSTLAARVLSAIADTSRPSKTKPAGEPFDPAAAARGYVAALAEEARAEGFRWPDLGAQVEGRVARQQLPESLRGKALTSAGLAARIQVLVAEIEAIRAKCEPDSPSRRLADTLAEIAGALHASLADEQGQPLPPAVLATYASIAAAFDRLQFDAQACAQMSALAPALSVLGLSPAQAGFLDQMADLPHGGELARFAMAARSSPQAATLVTRLAPLHGTNFDHDETGRLAQIDRLIVGAGPDGLDFLEEALARRAQAAPLFAALAAGGDTARLLSALAAGREALAGLASRLAPAEGSVFSKDEIARLSRIDGLVAGAGPGGLDFLEEALARRAQAAPLFAALGAGGDTARLLSALAAGREALAGLASRLAPKAGDRYQSNELDALRQLDTLIVRTAGTGLDQFFRLLDQGHRGTRLVDALNAGGDRARLILALAEGSRDLSGIISRLAPASGESFTAEEVARLEELDTLLVRSAGKPLETFAAQMLPPPEFLLISTLREDTDFAAVLQHLIHDAPLRATMVTVIQAAVRYPGLLRLMEAGAEIVGRDGTYQGCEGPVRTEASPQDRGEMTGAGRQEGLAVVGTPGRGAEQLRAAVEVLKWPGPALALLVTEASIRAGKDKTAAEENIDVLRRTGSVLAAGGIRSSMIGMIVGRNSKRCD
ncbi:hypothetical protein [Hyphomonas sp.]|jgi:hypothetical protein|uniref:hypothetical protein n=1 Tax=Hyphomonas sp. TaxID=87 RepID=UPI00391C546E